MSHPSSVAMPHRPYRVSSRSALTSPKRPHCANGHIMPATASRPGLFQHQPVRLASQKSMDILRHNPSRTQNLAIQTTQADHAPQLPQLLPSKSAPIANAGFYGKLKTIKSFIKRHTADSDDDSHEGFDTGRGADASTKTEPAYTSSNICRSKMLYPSPSIHSASHRRVPRPPNLTESFGRSEESSRSRLPVVGTEHNQQRHPGAGPQPNLSRAISKPSITRGPEATSFSELRSKQDSPRRFKAQRIESENPTHHDPPTVGKSGANSSSTTASESVDLEEGVNHSDGDSSEEESGELTCDATIDDITESFEINVARELKPATACKLVLNETEKSSPAVSVRVSSAGSSARSSSSFGDFCRSNRGGMSPCSSLPSPSPKSQDGEDYINIHQIRRVIRGLTCLLEKLDPQDELPDPLHRTPSNQPYSHLDQHVRVRINHAEFLRMIKQELDR